MKFYPEGKNPQLSKQFETVDDLKSFIESQLTGKDLSLGQVFVFSGYTWVFCIAKIVFQKGLVGEWNGAWCSLSTAFCWGLGLQWTRFQYRLQMGCTSRR